MWLPHQTTRLAPASPKSAQGTESATLEAIRVLRRRDAPAQIATPYCHAGRSSTSEYDSRSHHCKRGGLRLLYRWLEETSLPATPSGETAVPGMRDTGLRVG